MRSSLLKYSPRVKSLSARFSAAGIDGLLVVSPANISYLTYYDSRDSYLLVTPKKTIYITDSRYTVEAKERLKGIASVHQIAKSPWADISALIRAYGCKRVGFEDIYMTCAQHTRLKEGVGEQVVLAPVRNLVEDLRMCKDARELAMIRKAIEITAEAFVYLKEMLRPGIREVEVAAELERFVRYRGSRGSSFDIIVASGPNAAFPHHISSERKLRQGEPVKIDMGVDYQGYKSDLTRVFFLGKIKPLVRRVYDIVLKAQEKALKLAKPGIAVSVLDKAARGYISEKGYGRYFGHNLGHGVGLEVHEAPSLSATGLTVLKPGMVFTVEPGIYLPGKFGIRIEDMVVVTDKTCEVLSGAIDK